MSSRAAAVVVFGLLIGSAVGAAAAGLRHDAVSAALQGDLTEIAERARDLDRDSLSGDDLDWLDGFEARFLDRSERPDAVTDSPLAEEIIAAYRTYWTGSLLGDEPVDAAETRLTDVLRGILAAHDRPAPTGDAVLDEVVATLEAEGLHGLSGRTPPLLELMVWAGQDTTGYEVELTDGSCEVTVFFLSDFVVKGWAHWATLGRASTGGWATKEALFCLRDDYDLESERFRVSYLQHEGRHFADYAKYPALESADLEYRAKLTELVYADSTRGHLLAMFAGHAAPNPAAPHSLANHAVITDLAREIPGATGDDAGSWDAEAVREAALRLLGSHDDALVQAGAGTTPGVIPSRFAPPAPDPGSR